MQRYVRLSSTNLRKPVFAFASVNNALASSASASSSSNLAALAQIRGPQVQTQTPTLAPIYFQPKIYTPLPKTQPHPAPKPLPEAPPHQAIKRVVVFRKLSLLEQRQQALKETGLKTCKSLEDDKIRHSHSENEKSIEHVKNALIKKNIETVVVKTLEPERLKWADMIITVGGDGTFLRAAQSFVEQEATPILAVNSSPKSSYGFFCAATVDNFDQMVDSITAGAVETFPLWRMKILVNGEPAGILAINDALYAGTNPAEAVSYQLLYKGKRQHQVSSGIWISTPAGSTAAIAAAGGEKLDLHEQKLQFRVRELFPKSVVDEPIMGGLIDEEFELISRMPESKLYIDGHRQCINLKFGDHVSFKVTDKPLPWIRPMHPESYWGAQRWRAPWEKQYTQQFNKDSLPCS